MEKYVEVSLLNQGSYGTVQLVQEVKSKKYFAAKRISLALSTREDVNTEIAVHSRLDKHPHAVHLHEHFEDPQRIEHVLILEYCAGGDLHDVLAKGNKPSSAEIKGIMLQLVDVLQFAHARHVYHRDVKPENIFLASSNQIKLGDWGLASTKKFCSDFETGSDQYMAPECFDRSMESYNAEKADIWALGIVFLNVLFGRVPFKEATERDLLFRDFASSRETLYDIFPALTVDVFAALREALALNPDNRSLHKFKQALLKIRTWTTDEEAEQLERRRAGLKPTPLFAQQQQFQRSSAKMVPVVRKPFRVPTAVARSLKTPSASPWDIHKMYTPPTHQRPLKHPNWNMRRKTDPDSPFAKSRQFELEQLAELDEESRNNSESDGTSPNTDEDALVLGEMESDDEPITDFSKILDKPPTQKFDEFSVA